MIVGGYAVAYVWLRQENTGGTGAGTLRLRKRGTGAGCSGYGGSPWRPWRLGSVAPGELLVAVDIEVVSLYSRNRDRRVDRYGYGMRPECRMDQGN
mgnify:CR=1 FL=1